MLSWEECTFAQVAVVEQDVQAKTMQYVIANDGVDKVLTEVSGLLPHEPLRDPALVVGRRTTRMLAMGDVVLSDAVELPPLIQKGDVVTMMVESPGLLVTAKGIAQEKGKAGDLVRVKNVASGREVVGKVESEKTVRVGL